MSTKTLPAAVKGIVAIVTDAEGCSVAQATDFHQNGYGGFSLRNSQEVRVRSAVGRAVVRAYCSPVIADVLEEYDIDRIMAKLTRDKGFQLHLVPVGHDDEA